MTDAAMRYLSLAGNVLIFCVGINLVWGKRIRAANLLPAVLLAVFASFLPITFYRSIINWRNEHERSVFPGKSVW